MPTGVELATAWIRIVPSMDGVQGELTGQMGPEAEQAGKAAGSKFSTGMKATITAASAVIVASVVGIFSASINAASDLNEAGTAVQAIFGDATKGINTWAKSASTNLGQSQLEALNAAKSFGVFGTAAGLTQEENAKFSTSLAALASDFASFHNVSPQEAIEAIGSGLRGEAEPLRKFGILMDDASLKAQAMKMGIFDGNGTLGQQAKILAANALIFDQAGAAQGDFARTSDGLANQQRILDASVTNLSASVGQALLPVFQQLIAVAIPVVNFFRDNPALVNALAIAVGVLTAAIVAVNIAMWVLSVNPIVFTIMGIALAIGLLIAAIVLLVMNWDQVVAWITEVWNGFVTWVISVTNGFVSWWNSLWTAFGAWIANLWNGFVNLIKTAWNAYLTWVMSIITGFVSWWNGIWSAFGAWISNLWNNFIAVIRAVLMAYISWVMGNINGFLGWWNGVWSAISSFVISIWNTLTAAIRAAWSGVSSWVMGAVNGFMGWWNGIWGTVGNIISSVFGSIARIISGAWDGVVSTIRGAVNNIIGLINGAIGAINNIISAVGGLVGIDIKIPKVPGLYKGGTVTGTGSVIVGERGPELLTLPKGASVNPDIPNAGDNRRQYTVIAAPGRTAAQELTDLVNRQGGGGL